MIDMPRDGATETNRSLAALFLAIADQLEVRRENPHRIKAYRRGAETLLGLHEDVAAVAQRAELKQLPGIGRDLAAKIDEFLVSGTIQLHEELKTPLPAHIAAWTALPGLSEVIVHHLYFRLAIRTLSDLEMLVRSHMLRTLPGAAVSEKELLMAIEVLQAETQENHSAEH
jgi:DNA polymerase (family 10)